MERLSSCYFCGVAVEAEVREYPTVVGDLEGLELPPEADRPTVPLCRSCRSKLDRILAGLGTGASDGGNAVVATDRTAREASTSDGDSQESGDDSREAAGDPDATGSDHADSAVTDGRSTTASNEETDGSQGIGADAEIFGDTDAVRLDEDPRDDGTSDAAGEQRETESPTGTDTEDGTPGEDGDSADGNDHGSDGEEATRSFTASQAAGGRSTSSHGEATADDEAGGESHDDSGDGGGGADPGGPPAGSGNGGEVPQEAYDKVVRLLQNREFPVEEGDILAVATNAYGLNRRDCEAALERLTEQGVIDRDGGRLYRSG